MKTTYKLTIEKPCHKGDWNLMTNSDKGKYCSICTKNVYDFATWTDEEIINFLNTSDESICAKLNYSQLNRIVSLNQKSSIKHWHKIVASLLVFISSSNVYATKKNIELTNQYQSQNKSKEEIEKTLKHNTFPTDSIKNKISGIVIEEDSIKPIKNITIEIKGTQIKTKTDSLGHFSFIIPENYANNEITLMLIAEYGFEGKTEKTVSKNELPLTNLIIVKPYVLLGEVIYYKPKKWWQFWKRR